MVFPSIVKRRGMPESGFLNDTFAGVAAAGIKYSRGNKSQSDKNIDPSIFDDYLKRLNEEMSLSISQSTNSLDDVSNESSSLPQPDDSIVDYRILERSRSVDKGRLAKIIGAKKRLGARSAGFSMKNKVDRCRATFDYEFSGVV
eukprot:CAMPEP_0194290684 /NCGR_PEP_ID=MMETSP0169-20130528/41830_1 /TAXON_ID=218684 /ORGANISM="Corethron pennatum, Strain L29A3" /LENGTH=143 /DNA_ID=CAMNT_0039038351 /DNA_START=151 /DNA_END=582 /DNA_ORIENTATION=-